MVALGVGVTIVLGKLLEGIGDDKVKVAMGAIVVEIGFALDGMRDGLDEFCAGLAVMMVVLTLPTGDVLVDELSPRPGELSASSRNAMRALLELADSNEDKVGAC